VAGFGGLRDSDGEVRFRPRLPEQWQRLRFRVQIRGQLIEVDMTAEETTYRLLEGRGLLVMHGDEQLRLTPDEPLSRPAEAAPAAPVELPRAA
jgi:alpha,alpha-trehalose phosphorylase